MTYALFNRPPAPRDPIDDKSDAAHDNRVDPELAVDDGACRIIAIVLNVAVVDLAQG